LKGGFYKKIEGGKRKSIFGIRRAGKPGPKVQVEPNYVCLDVKCGNKQTGQFKKKGPDGVKGGRQRGCGRAETAK